MKSNTQQPAPSAAPTPETKKKMPKWAKVLIIVGAVVLVAIVGGIIAANMALKNNDKEVKGFLSSIYASNYSQAYDYFSPQLKEVQFQDVFESQIEGLQAAGVDDSCHADWNKNSVSSSTSTGNTKEVGGTLNCDKGSFSASFKLVKQGDNYKLYSYSIQPK